jgi:hypothetical protein
MNKEKRKVRKPVNLYLSEDAIKKLERLPTAMRRPSKSNVVESLIVDEAIRLGMAA